MMAVKRRLTQQDWADAAVAALAEGGLAAVAVEPVAARLGATKGSFYWHFDNREALVEAAVGRWVERHTEAIIAGLADVDDPARRLTALFDAVFAHRTGHRVELALLSHVDDPAIGPVVADVTSRRMAFLVRCFRDLGCTPAAARHHATLAYTSYLGLIQAQQVTGDRFLPAADRRAYLSFLRRMLRP